MFRTASLVTSDAGINTGMRWLHGIDREHADSLTTFHDGNPIQRVKYFYIVIDPANVDGEVTLGHGTTDRSCAEQVERLFTELKGHDDGEDCTEDCRRGLGKIIGKTAKRQEMSNSRKYFWQSLK